MARLAVGHFGVVNLGAFPGRVTVAVAAAANEMIGRAVGLVT